MDKMRTAIILTFLFSMVTTIPQARAEETDIAYEMVYDIEDPRYAAALDVMLENVYTKRAPYYWDYDKNDWREYPLLDIGEFDLNRDGNNEFVAYPIEQSPRDEGLICKYNGSCPHFIFRQASQGEYKLIGVISTQGLSVDNSFFRGFRRLRAQTERSLKNPTYYELYQFENGLYKKLELDP